MALERLEDRLTRAFADHHQLHIAAVIEGVRGGQPRTISHVYDQDAR